jgi:hypothetical protein
MSHYMFCPRQKKIISRTFKIRGSLGFLCPKVRDRESERERGRAGKGKEKREREKENTKERAIIFLNCPGQYEKSIITINVPLIWKVREIIFF